MKRNTVFAITLAATFVLAIGSAIAPAPADPVVYSYAALPGPVSNCQWFDDNLNDHSIDAIIRQTDLLYNRAALPPGANVNLGQTERSARGDVLVDFHLDGRLLCAGEAAFHPEMTETTPTPPPP